MSDLVQLRDPANLRQAWQWIRSNPDATWKSYFRPHYQHYAVAEEALLADLSDRLKRGVYAPEKANKLYQPKASGILRPYSLLSVEDQIVYQAAVNLVAEKLHPRMAPRYFKQVFGHLYAGRNSTWFYRKWSEGYKAFNDGARRAFADGFTYTASFDLTACYDSLDHQVLRHFLGKLGCDPAFSQLLTGWLETWTATDEGIFHHHGIPQGPLSSGLLSEVVLSHFDQLKLRGVEFRYFRYVDDIRLFARSEHDLRRLLVLLDHMSKDIGLFPQSGKISIHLVDDIERELKSVSTPVETAITREFVDQPKLQARIRKLTRGYRVSDPTRFKYLLAHALPSAPLTSRLWRILEKHPELYRNVCNYLRRYKRIPRVPAERLVAQIAGSTLYQSVRAEFIRAADGRLPERQDRQLGRIIRPLWAPRGAMHADLQVAIGRYLIRLRSLSAGQIAFACQRSPSWWARAQLIDALRLPGHDPANPPAVLAGCVQDRVRDPALAAARQVFELGLVPKGTRKGWNKSAELLLREVGVFQRSMATFCGIVHFFGQLDRRAPAVDWRRLFAQNYPQAERMAVAVVAASRTNITEFVNILDGFDDLLLDAVYRADGNLGAYTLGRIGSYLYQPNRLLRTYPACHALAHAVHEERGWSIASHPVHRKTGRPTRRISYSFLPKARRLLVAAVRELLATGLAR